MKLIILMKYYYSFFKFISHIKLMSFIENFENNKNNDSMEYSIVPKFLSLLNNKTSNFYVLKPEISFLPDTEKFNKFHKNK